MLISGGSGITPTWRSSAACWPSSPASRVTLLYASRSAADEMFSTELDDLQSKYAGRLTLWRVHEVAAEGFEGRSVAWTPPGSTPRWRPWGPPMSRRRGSTSAAPRP
ncbi:MAG: hypothetical protein R3F43_29220 [bacterium]